MSDYAERTFARLQAVRAENDLLRARVAELERLALVDPLTGVLNRRGIEAELRRGAARVARGGCGAVILIDLDHFKRLNDERGHAAGDEALRLVGEVLGREVRAADVAGRWGGEEFLVVTSAHMAQAIVLAERLRIALGRRVGTTASIGVAAFADPVGGDAFAFKRADEALYRAKAEGRNRDTTSIRDLRKLLPGRYEL